jgi:hypothetical protein
MTASKARWAVSLLAIVGTLPYAVLKLMWVSGSRVGITDPDFGESTSMLVANLATFALELTAILLALAFVVPFGRRIPAPLVLVPMWIGTGLLSPILLIVPLQLLTGAYETGSDTADSPIAGWVYSMVYTGFTWQALFLLAGFVLYANARWGRSLRWTAPLAGWQRPSPDRRGRLLAGLAVAGVVAGGLALSVQAVGPFAPPVPNLVGFALLTAGAAAGLALLALPTSLPWPRWLAVVLTWIGTGAMTAWSSYLLVLLLVPVELVGDITVSWADVAAEAFRVAAGLGAAAAMVWLLRRRTTPLTAVEAGC